MKTPAKYNCESNRFLIRSSSWLLHLVHIRNCCAESICVQYSHLSPLTLLVAPIFPSQLNCKQHVCGQCVCVRPAIECQDTHLKIMESQCEPTVRTLRLNMERNHRTVYFRQFQYQIWFTNLTHQLYLLTSRHVTTAAKSCVIWPFIEITL